MNYTHKHKLAAALGGAVLLGGLLMSATAFAQTPSTQPAQGQGQHWGGPGMGQGARGQGVFGTVSAVDGSTLTITSKGFGKSASTTQTYTVDASSATVMKNNATSTLSAVAVGDTVMVAGTVSGTSVTATMIRDGIPQMPAGGAGGPGMRGHASTTPMNIPQGNGEPVVGGSITAISGSTLTITNTSNVTYTVDASSAAVTDHGATSSVSALAVGDNVLVQGAVNGNSVTASSVIDQGATKTGSGSGPAGMGKALGGIFGGIGGFFQKLFGFF